MKTDLGRTIFASFLAKTILIRVVELYFLADSGQGFADERAVVDEHSTIGTIDKFDLEDTVFLFVLNDGLEERM